MDLKKLKKVADSAFDEIKKKKIEEGQSKEEAKISAGKILSAAKSKSKGKAKTERKKPSKLEQLELMNERYGNQITFFDLPQVKKTITNLKNNPQAEIPQVVRGLMGKYEQYNKLAEKLPAVDKATNTPNPKKFKELIEKAKKINFFQGREMEGVNLSLSAQKSKLKKEAQQYCTHEFKTKYDAKYTEDARKKLTRTIECKKCKKKYIHSIAEDLSKEAMWR